MGGRKERYQEEEAEKNDLKILLPPRFGCKDAACAIFSDFAEKIIFCFLTHGKHTDLIRVLTSVQLFYCQNDLECVSIVDPVMADT